MVDTNSKKIDYYIDYVTNINDSLKVYVQQRAESVSALMKMYHTTESLINQSSVNQKNGSANLLDYSKLREFLISYRDIAFTNLTKVNSLIESGKMQMVELETQIQRLIGEIKTSTESIADLDASLKVSDQENEAVKAIYQDLVLKSNDIEGKLINLRKESNELHMILQAQHENSTMHVKIVKESIEFINNAMKNQGEAIMQLEKDVNAMQISSSQQSSMVQNWEHLSQAVHLSATNALTLHTNALDDFNNAKREYEFEENRARVVEMNEAIPTLTQEIFQLQTSKGSIDSENETMDSRCHSLAELNRLLNEQMEKNTSFFNKLRMQIQKAIEQTKVKANEVKKDVDSFSGVAELKIVALKNRLAEENVKKIKYKEQLEHECKRMQEFIDESIGSMSAKTRALKEQKEPLIAANYAEIKLMHVKIEQIREKLKSKKLRMTPDETRTPMESSKRASISSKKISLSGSENASEYDASIDLPSINNNNVQKKTSALREIPTNKPVITLVKRADAKDGSSKPSASEKQDEFAFNDENKKQSPDQKGVPKKQSSIPRPVINTKSVSAPRVTVVRASAKEPAKKQKTLEEVSVTSDAWFAENAFEL
jgi:DNA repair exonuclease SbcCD ATPase subunit